MYLSVSLSRLAEPNVPKKFTNKTLNFAPPENLKTFYAILKQDHRLTRHLGKELNIALRSTPKERYGILFSTTVAILKQNGDRQNLSTWRFFLVFQK